MVNVLITINSVESVMVILVLNVFIHLLMNKVNVKNLLVLLMVVYNILMRFLVINVRMERN